jgi:Zn-dependent peptidase ImmA (M78 family)
MMTSTIYRRLKKAFPFVDERAATEDDFFEYCDRHAIKVEFTPEIERGAYVPFLGRDHIFLNTRLFGWRLRHTMFHELGHVLLHAPTRAKRDAGDIREAMNFSCRKNHAEAEIVAALLLLPPHEIETALLEQRHMADETLADLIALRLEFEARRQATNYAKA